MPKVKAIKRTKSLRSKPYESSSYKRSSSRSSSYVQGTEALSLYRGVTGTTIMPDRYTTWLENSIHFYIPPAASTSAAGSYMSVLVNSIYQPFNTTYNAIAATNTYDMRGILVQGCTNSKNPMGYSTFASLYQQYKVLKYKVQVSVQPSITTDSLQLVVFPSGNEQIPSASAGSTNLAVMEGQPQARSKIVVTQAPSKDNTLSITQYVWDLMGRRKNQLMDFASTQVNSFPGTNDQGFVGIYLQQLNGANNTQPILVTVRLWQKVELTGLVGAIN